MRGQRRRLIGARRTITASAARRLTALLIVAVAVIAASPLAGTGASGAPARAAKSCPPGYVDASLSWGEKCLHTGELCKVGNPEYHHYGFDCPASGKLVAYDGANKTPTPRSDTKTSVAVGRTVLLGTRTRSRGCKRGALPDRRCSPGAYYSKLTRGVICSAAFHTSTIRNVPESEKHQVELEYGMTPRSYGYTIEIDHIVPLEVGGSNEIANLYPEPGSGTAGYHFKDRLENRLHDLVCTGALTLRAAQHRIAANWEKLYLEIFGMNP
jgi:hypothetical protein